LARGRHRKLRSRTLRKSHMITPITHTDLRKLRYLRLLHLQLAILALRAGSASNG